MFIQHAIQKVQVNRFRNQYFPMSALSKVAFGFSAVVNEMVQNMMTTFE